MITSINHFQPQLNCISALLLSENKKPKTTYYSHRHIDYSWPKEELNDWYNANFKSFPLHTSAKSNEVIIHSTFSNAYRKYHGQTAIKDTENNLLNELEGDDRDGLLLSLEEFINEWLLNIFNDFAKAIFRVKNEPVFACVYDDLIVMKNLVNFYSAIRKSDDIQLIFFDNISIPKAVADQMTDVLIILLTDRINISDPYYSIIELSSSQLSDHSPFKIKWLASQQEFADLIHDLTDKGYISLPEIAHTLKARGLTKMFDFSASQRKTDSNITQNILTLIKPVLDKDNKEKTTYTYRRAGYISKFDSIPIHTPKEKNSNVSLDIRTGMN